MEKLERSPHPDSFAKEILWHTQLEASEKALTCYYHPSLKSFLTPLIEKKAISLLKELNYLYESYHFIAQHYPGTPMDLKKKVAEEKLNQAQQAFYQTPVGQFFQTSSHQWVLFKDEDSTQTSTRL